MADLSIMVLCGRSPRHLYVVNRLSREMNVLAIIQEAGSHWTAKKVLQFLHPNIVWRKIWRWLRDRRRYIWGGEGKFFFGETSPHLERSDLLIKVPHINHPDVIKLARTLQPDVIAVFGTSLIRGSLLDMGRIGIINLHGGLSPEYRGADCTFWALYNGEPEKIGCTLHFIDRGIDTGRLIAHVCPEVRKGDDELTLFWRSVQGSSEIYAEALRRLAQGEALGQPQVDKGRLYQVKDRGLRQERYLAKRLSSGMLANTQLPSRVRWFKTE